MNIKRLLMIILMIVITPCSVKACNDFLNGRGTVQEPYLIYTEEDLKRIGNDEEWSLDKHYKLMNDIVLEKPKEGESNWRPIGTTENPFTGVFDGNGKTISNIIIVSSESNAIGFFGRISGEKTKVEGLGLLNVNINLDDKTVRSTIVGTLTGSVFLGTIKDCYSIGNVSGGKSIS